MADRAEVDALAAAVEERHGALTILVNNAGVGMTGPYSDMTSEDWSFIRSINLDGVINCCSAFTPPMLAAHRGHVVNISSGLGFTPTALESAYGTTKAAVLHLSQCLRADWAAQGVGVTAICPGFIDTPIAASTRFTGGREDPTQRERLVRGFKRGHAPDMVGEGGGDGNRRKPGRRPRRRRIGHRVVRPSPPAHFGSAGSGPAQWSSIDP